MGTSKVRIHNDLWRVRTVSADSTEMNSPEAVMLGRTDLTKLEITIREDMPYSVTMSTVIHEMCHAYCLSHGAAIRDEESACDFFGAQGMEIIAAAVLVMSDLCPDGEPGDDEKTGDISWDDDDSDDFEIIGNDIEDDGK